MIRGHCKWSGVQFTAPTRLENDNSGGVLIAREQHVRLHLLVCEHRGSRCGWYVMLCADGSLE